MNLKRWPTFILMIGLFLVLSPLGAQADPYPPSEPHPYYHHPHGNAYGWHGERPHDWDRHREYSRHYMGPENRHAYMHQFYAAQPPVAYLAPVTPMMGMMQPCPQPQPFFSPPAAPGLHGQITF
jgi:hypothetical protein